MPVIPAFGRLRQEDGKFRPGWTTSRDPVSKTNKKKVKREWTHIAS
jgi:hypothetical protein